MSSQTLGNYIHLSFQFHAHQVTFELAAERKDDLFRNIHTFLASLQTSVKLTKWQLGFCISETGKCS